MTSQQSSKETDWAWAAGLFEGEGSISLSKGGAVRLKLGMTDHDVVLRFAEVVGGGSVYHREEMRQVHWKACTYWETQKLALVQKIMERLLPYLGSRRTARWEEVMSYRESLRPITTCPQCGEEFKPLRRNQVCCGHDCSWRYSAKVGKYTDRAGHRRSANGYATERNRRRALGPKAASL